MLGICVPFRDKHLIHILVVATYLPVRLTPKIFHLSVSHRKFLANNSVYEFKKWETPFVAAGIRHATLRLRMKTI